MWLSTPEVSLQEVKSSWDAVGRIERLLDDQARFHQIWMRQMPCCMPLVSAILVLQLQTHHRFCCTGFCSRRPRQTKGQKVQACSQLTWR